ncbi:hypothetical protein GCM10027416_30450 [Okibacterium endophyticum]
MAARLSPTSAAAASSVAESGDVTRRAIPDRIRIRTRLENLDVTFSEVAQELPRLVSLTLGPAPSAPSELPQ